MQNRLRSVATDELRPHVCTLCYFHDKLAPLTCGEALAGGEEWDTETRPRTTRHSSASGMRSPSAEVRPGGEVRQKGMPTVTKGIPAGTRAGMSTDEISQYLAKLGAEMRRELTRDSQEPRPATVDTSYLRNCQFGLQSCDTLRPATSSSFLRRRAFKLRLDSQAKNQEGSWTKSLRSMDSFPMSLFRRRQEDEEAKERRLRNFSLSNAVRFYISSRETK